MLFRLIKTLDHFVSSVYRVSFLWKEKPVKIFYSLDIAYRLQIQFSLNGYQQVNFKKGLFQGKCTFLVKYAVDTF